MEGSEKFVWTEMPTHMGRSILSVKVRPPSLQKRAVHVSTAHFESLSSATVREQQLKVYARMAAKEAEGPSILCGDFNFCSYRNYGDDGGPLENSVLARVLPDYTDVWADMKSGNDPGYTFDSERNSNIRQEEQMRYDRILFRENSQRPGYAASVELIGTQKIESIGMHPSDHFGILCRFHL